MLSNSTKVSYVRVCVEIFAEKPPPDSVWIEVERSLGESFEQAVEYESRFTICNKCRNFGHPSESCSSVSNLSSTVFSKKKVVAPSKVLKEVEIVHNNPSNPVSVRQEEEGWTEVLSKSKNKRRRIKKKNVPEASIPVVDSLGDAETIFVDASRKLPSAVSNKQVISNLKSSVWTHENQTPVCINPSKTSLHTLSVADEICINPGSSDKIPDGNMSSGDAFSAGSSSESCRMNSGKDSGDRAEVSVVCTEMVSMRDVDSTVPDKPAFSGFSPCQNQTSPIGDLSENIDQPLLQTGSTGKDRIDGEMDLLHTSEQAVLQVSAQKGDFAGMEAYSVSIRNPIPTIESHLETSSGILSTISMSLGGDKHNNISVYDVDGGNCLASGSGADNIENTGNKMPVTEVSPMSVNPVIPSIPPGILSQASTDPVCDGHFFDDEVGEDVPILGENGEPHLATFDPNYEIFPPGFSPKDKDMPICRVLLKERVSRIPPESQARYLEDIDQSPDEEIQELLRVNYSPLKDGISFKNVRRSPRLRRMASKLADMVNPKDYAPYVSGPSKGLKKGK